MDHSFQLTLQYPLHIIHTGLATRYPVDKFDMTSANLAGLRSPRPSRRRGRRRRHRLRLGWQVPSRGWGLLGVGWADEANTIVVVQFGLARARAFEACPRRRRGRGLTRRRSAVHFRRPGPHNQSWLSPLIASDPSRPI